MKLWKERVVQNTAVRYIFHKLKTDAVVRQQSADEAIIKYTSSDFELV